MKPIIIWGKSDSLLAALTGEAKQELTDLLIQAYEQGKADAKPSGMSVPEMYYPPGAKTFPYQSIIYPAVFSEYTSAPHKPNIYGGSDQTAPNAICSNMQL